MTDASDFERAYTLFRAMPYPAYPQSRELRDWNSRLLTLDACVAGYAFQVNAGRMRAYDVPNLDGLVNEIKILSASLGKTDSSAGQDVTLVIAYRSYVAALERLVLEIRDLAYQERRIAE